MLSKKIKLSGLKFRKSLFKKTNEKSLIQEIKKFRKMGAKLDKNKKESPQRGEYIDLKILITKKIKLSGKYGFFLFSCNWGGFWFFLKKEMFKN